MQKITENNFGLILSCDWKDLCVHFLLNFDSYKGINLDNTKKIQKLY